MARPKMSEMVANDRAIRAAAIRALLESGDAATIEGIAKAAGVTRKSVYARYANKTELFLEVSRGVLNDYKVVEYASDGPFEDRLHSYLCSALAILGDSQSVTIRQLLTVNSDVLTDLKSDIVTAIHCAFFVPLEGLLRDAKARQEIVIDDLDSAARVIINLVFSEEKYQSGAGYSWMQPKEPLSYAVFLSKLLTQGLGAIGR